MSTLETPIEVPVVVNRGWRVVAAGLGINLALGILYTWSVISKGIPSDWEWSQFDKSLPYSVACLVFSVMMVPAGRLLDRLGARLAATIGGVLVGAGMLLASFTTSPLGYAIGFGVLAGSGFGFGYAAATPPAVKWFPASKTGLIAGLVVSGFGLASVYTAPLTNWLISSFDLPTAMAVLGVAFLIIVTGLAQLLEPPPPGYVPPGSFPVSSTTANVAKQDYAPSEILRTPQFFLLWFGFACGAGAGLMIISKLADIASLQVGLQLGFVLVAVLALGNGVGRIAAGSASDRIGRGATLFICFIVQAIVILLLSQATTDSPLANPVALAILSALIGANYGANLALFPAITKDYYGLQHFGANYGLVFTAWGLGGFALALLAGSMYTRYQSFAFAYYSSAALLALAAASTLLLRPPRRH